MSKSELYIEYMEGLILIELSKLEKGYGNRKFHLSKKTGIPEDVLTVLLKRLKIRGKIELIMIWSENTGLPDGSGYALAGSLKYEFNQQDNNKKL